jgi:23S rRNA (uracil1939-C5)-methyltransferase
VIRLASGAAADKWIPAFAGMTKWDVIARRRRHERPMKGRTGVREPARVATLRIERLGARGDGIAEMAGRPVYVAGALPGELVEVALGPPRGDGLAARLRVVLEASPARRPPPCGHFGECGGCALQHLADDAYGAWKRQQLAELLARFALAPAPLMPLVRIAAPTRRRIDLVAERRRGRVSLGFHERGSHRIVDINSCPIMRPGLQALLAPLRAVLGAVLEEGTSADLLVTDGDSGIDLLVRAARTPGPAARQALAAFAAANRVARIAWQEPGQPVEPIVLLRRPTVRFAGIAVEPPPGGFLQASAEGEAALVSAALALLPRRGRIADLHAGCGTFSFAVAAAAPDVAVRAMEGDGAALDALLAAARRGGLADRITGERRDLAANPPQPAELARFDAVLFDPPRGGAREVAEALARSKVARIVAVSCNPASFARDARLLVDGGFRLGSVTPIDQFVWSPHLELVGEFSR